MKNIFEKTPKNVLYILLVKLNYQSLINFCLSSKHIYNICSDINFRLYYFNMNYNLHYNLLGQNHILGEQISKKHFCQLAKKFVIIMKFAEEISICQHYVNEHKILHPQLIHDCDLCMYTDIHDFETILKIYLYNYPILFSQKPCDYFFGARVKAENVKYLFRMANLETNLHITIPMSFANKYFLNNNT